MRIIIGLMLLGGMIVHGCQVTEISNRDICARDKEVRLAQYVAEHAAWNEIIVCK